MGTEGHIHELRLPNRWPNACVRVCRKAEGGEIVLQFLRSDSDLETEFSETKALSSDGQMVKANEARVALAIGWILDLDSQTKRRFLGGRVSEKRIRDSAPTPLVTLDETASPDEYWQLRQPVTHLIRPLLIPPPEQSVLFPYQVEGVAWLLKNPLGVLADDMGLGKTVQVITAIRSLIANGQSRGALVVCPKTLLANWEAELTKWAPELSRVRVTPQGNSKDEAWAAIFNRVHVTITNYEQFRDVPQALAGTHLQVLVADEAHKVRNVGSLATQGIRKLKAQRFWALTGTPIERDPEDLVTLLSSMAPTRFSARDSALSAGVLRARARPYVLRRLKRDLLEQLPPVIESVEVLDLLPEQLEAYRQALRSDGMNPSPGSVLTITNQLRTICDFDPSTGQSIKADRITEILETISLAEEKAVVFSYLLDPLRLVEKRVALTLGSQATVRIEGAMSSSERDAALTRFKEDPTATVLLASLRVAGEGLTLTDANHVLFFNEWWNPSANQQARDRVVRIGQTRGVRVYKFRCRNTIEDWLAMILEQKTEVFDEIIDRLARPSIEDRDPPSLPPALEDLRKELERESHS